MGITKEDGSIVMGRPKNIENMSTDERIEYYNKKREQDACERLEGVRDLNIVKFTKDDIVRNKIITEIEERYSD